jgi:hypothetical protein
MVLLGILAAAAATAAPSASVAAARSLCTPVIASRGGGQVDGMEVTASAASRGWIVIRGETILFIGAAASRPGAASPHHLIRAAYEFTCWVRGGRAIKVELTQPQ